MLEAGVQVAWAGTALDRAGVSLLGAGLLLGRRVMRGPVARMLWVVLRCAVVLLGGTGMQLEVSMVVIGLVVVVVAWVMLNLIGIFLGVTWALMMPGGP